MYRSVCGGSLRGFDDLDEVGELLRSHLADLAYLLLEDEAVARLAHLCVVQPEDFAQGWPAGRDDVLVGFLGLGEAGVRVDGFHVLAGPLAQRQQGD